MTALRKLAKKIEICVNFCVTGRDDSLFYYDKSASRRLRRPVPAAPSRELPSVHPPGFVHHLCLVQCVRGSPEFFGFLHEANNANSNLWMYVLLVRHDANEQPRMGSVVHHDTNKQPWMGSLVLNVARPAALLATLH